MSKKGKYEVIAFYDPQGELYAFSAKKSFVKSFEETRKLRGFYRKKLHLNEMQYRNLLFFETNKRLIMNVLTDGEKSYDFVTTEKEDFELGVRCDQIYDKLMEIERKIINIPFTDEVREVVEKVMKISKKESGSMGKFNTFEIFLDLFKDSIL